MAGYRIGDPGGPAGRPAPHAGSVLHVGGLGACTAIMAIAKDFQDLIRAECPRCRTGSGDCLVERLRVLARETRG